MALTAEELQKIREEETARQSIRKELTNPYGLTPTQQEYYRQKDQRDQKTRLSMNEKSQVVSFVLTFFFGCFGLLYTSVWWALVFIFVGIPLVLLSGGLLGIFVWIGSMVLGYMLVEKHNANL